MKPTIDSISRSMPFLIIVAWFLMSWNWNIAHEQAHVAISGKFGCNATIVSLSPWYGWTFSNCSAANLTESEAIALAELHSINEIVTYNIKSMADTLFELFFLWWLIRVAPPKLKKGWNP